MKQQKFNKCNANNKIRIFLILLFTAALVSAQTANIRVNRFWGSVNATGINTPTSYSSTNLNLFADQSAYGMSLQGDETYFSGEIILAFSNWKDTDGTVIPNVICPVTNVKQPNGLEILEPMKNYLRYGSPVDSVYYQSRGFELPTPDFGKDPIVDPAQCFGSSDQTVSVTNKYFNGLTVTRRIIAWGQKSNDNYVISDLTFNNNSNDTLHNFYIVFQEGNDYGRYSDGNNPSVAGVDAYFNGSPRRWFHYYGARTSDSLRIFYEYAGDDPEKAGDNMGQPLTQQQGRLLDKDFWFSATLHASEKPYKPAGTPFPAIDANDVDDMNQPTVTTVASPIQKINLPLLNGQSELEQQGWYDLVTGKTLASEDLTGADIRPGHHRSNIDELGEVAPGGEPGLDASGIHWENMIYSYGPYTFAPGEQIRIVKASGIAGISRELAEEVGKKWLAQTLSDPPNLPDQRTGYFPTNFVFPADATENDKRKDRWMSLGIKDLHETVSRAKQNFLSQYNISPTPAPPEKSDVTPLTTGGIHISWEPSASESNPGFVGYKLYRKISSYDTVFYKLVYEGKNNSFLDAKVRPSPKYFYYIQAGVKYNTDTLWSSRFWRYNINGTSANTPPNTSGLENIVIAPNPFNYRDPVLAKYLFESPKNLTITFFNLPPVVTISVYTENGDLVRKEYNSGTGDYKMKMVNESGQSWASGIYVVVFQTPDGNFSYQKLVVAR